MEGTWEMKGFREEENGNKRWNEIMGKGIGEEGD
jgi:hypothetical protein